MLSDDSSSFPHVLLTTEGLIVGGGATCAGGDPEKKFNLGIVNRTEINIHINLVNMWFKDR